jgi:hypothetical protein
MARQNIFNEEYQSDFESLDIPEDFEDTIQEALDDFEEPEEVVEYLEEPEERPSKKTSKRSDTDSSYRLNDTESNIMQLAMVQLEQAKLYDMFLKHNLFEGVQANPRALKKVENELKGFILERIQILLGMKSEEKQSSEVTITLPFNEIEIEFLKALSFKGTKGESATINSSTMTAVPQKMTHIEPAAPNKLRSIAPKPAPALSKRPLPIQRPTPVKRPMESRVAISPSLQKAMEKASTDGKFSKKELEIAARDMEKMSKRKAAYEMDAQELMEANKRIKQRKAPPPSAALPMPTADQMMMQYAGRSDIASRNPSVAGILKTLSPSILSTDNNEE